MTRLGLPSLPAAIGTLTLYRGIAQGVLPTDTTGRLRNVASNGVVLLRDATSLGGAISVIGAGSEAAFV